MNEDEMQDIQPAVPPFPSKSSVSRWLDQVTTSPDEFYSSVQPSVDDVIPQIQLSPSMTEFTSFSELSEFLKHAPLVHSAFTELYSKL
jgi:hypothetical protein